MDWTKHLCFNDRTSHSDMRVLLTSSSLRVCTHTQMVTQMHVCDGVQWVPVSDLLTCWRAAQGLLIFLCDPNIHYTNLFWALTMCKALFFCLVDSGVNNSESGWLFPTSLCPWTLGLSWTWMGHSSIHLLIWKISYSEAYAYLHDCVIK